MAVVADSPLLEQPGIFTIVIGDEDAKRGLRGAKGKVDDWLYELIDSVVFHAQAALRETAPGRIKGLVDVDIAKEREPSVFEGSAGVLPDPLENFVSRRGSRRGDFPYYVEAGTGVYGEHASPILAVPGHLMGPIDFEGRDIFIRSFAGQRGQHYGEHAFEETVAWVPAQIELSKAALEARLLSRT